MRKQTFYWALGVPMLLLIVWLCYRGGQPALEPELTVEGPASTEQVDAGPILKAPPLGETFLTGHWEGDQWQRTAPLAPATVMYEGKELTLDELFSKGFRPADDRGDLIPWEERVAMLNRAIAEAPYSERAYGARMLLAERDENGERIWDNAVIFERLQPLLAYHPDCPDLLQDLLTSGMHIYPEAAIHYGTEALKYAEMYRMDSTYGAYPESIHHFLGFAYQNIGDYSKALEHHRQALKLINAYPGRATIGSFDVIVTNSIHLILSGKPSFGPLSQKDRDVDVGGLPVRAPVASEAVSAPQELPSIQPGAPLLDVREGDSDDDVSVVPPSGDLDARDFARQQAQQRYQEAQQRAEQAQQRFENFVGQLHRIASLKTETDFEKFLMQELVKQLRAPDTAPDTRPSVSADRMRRAAQIFRKSKTPAEGMKALREVDPDLAKTLHRVRR